MSQRSSSHQVSAAFWMVICCLLPILIIYGLAAAGIMISPVLLLLMMLLCWMAMSSHLMSDCHADQDRRSSQPTGSDVTDANADDDFDTSSVFESSHQRWVGDAKVIDGEFINGDPQAVYEQMRERLADRNATPLLQEDEFGQPRLVIVPGRLDDPRPGSGPMLHLLLFIAAIATTTWAGALHQGINLLEEPGRFTAGLPYSLTLMLILGAHELGHYFAARHHGVNVTLPYFIPVPFALGTFGAFIRMKSLPPNRKALFDVAVAGPLAGLVFAVPALLIGLGQSQIVEAAGDAAANVGIMHHHGTGVGSSVLLAFLAKLSLGEAISQGHQLILHPLAFAGWLGLIVTALNLLPIGQLDGGHIADAMFGIRRSASISTVALACLFFLGLFVWSGLLMWALIAFFMAGGKGIASANDLIQLDPGRKALGVVSFVILLLILTPVPHAFYESLGIHCPYL